MWGRATTLVLLMVDTYPCILATTIPRSVKASSTRLTTWLGVSSALTM